jgi:hypothetical protein
MLNIFWIRIRNRNQNQNRNFPKVRTGTTINSFGSTTLDDRTIGLRILNKIIPDPHK